MKDENAVLPSQKIRKIHRFGAYQHTMLHNDTNMPQFSHAAQAISDGTAGDDNTFFPFRYGDATLRCTLLRRSEPSRQVHITVSPDGGIAVTVDADTPPATIAQALSRRAHWITTTLQTFAKQRTHALPSRYVGGETHFYLGRRHQLHIVDETEGTAVKLLRGKLLVPSRWPWSDTPECAAARADEVKKRLTAWYRRRAAEVLPRSFAATAATVPWLQEVPPLRLLAMKTQWGSCSPRGTILLNPQLIKAPRECIDYVIFHELCHLKEHNHSAHFWNLLMQLYPR